MNKIKFPKNTIVLGGKGMTGYYIDDSVPNYDLVDGFDLTNLKTLEDIFEKHKPVYVLLFAAETNIRRAENHCKETFDINTRVAYYTAKLCKKHKSKLFFISSVDVFDGEKNSPYVVNDVPNPIITYGDSKIAAEGAIQKILIESYIIRAGWMFGGFERDIKFVSYMVNSLIKGKKLKAVNDRKGSATYSKDLVKLLSEMTNGRHKYGTYHFCNSGICTRYDQALVIANEWNNSETDVDPVSSDEFPKHRSLKNATMQSSFDSRDWKNALTEYIKEWRERWQKK